MKLLVIVLAVVLCGCKQQEQHASSSNTAPVEFANTTDRTSRQGRMLRTVENMQIGETAAVWSLVMDTEGFVYAISWQGVGDPDPLSNDAIITRTKDGYCVRLIDTRPLPIVDVRGALSYIRLRIEK